MKLYIHPAWSNCVTVLVTAPLLDVAGRRWLVSDALTLADVAVASRLIYAEAARLPLGRYDEVRRWRVAVAAMKAWQAAQPATRPMPQACQ